MSIKGEREKINGKNEKIVIEVKGQPKNEDRDRWIDMVIKRHHFHFIYCDGESCCKSSLLSG